MIEPQGTPLVFNIQKFSIHDGPGIRTTIFFKGCPLSCPWCHNPESQGFETEMIRQANGRMDKVGNTYSVAELVKKAAQDVIFYDRSGGGVTLSGGEVMAQNIEYITALTQQLQKKGIHVGIDTSGAVPFLRFEKILPYTDFFLYDVKVFDQKKHIQYMRIDNSEILGNLKRLSLSGAVLYLRLILIDGVNTDQEKDILPLLNWLKREHIQVEKIHLLPYHTLGKDKYMGLGKTPVLFRVPETDVLQKIARIFQEAGYNTIIGG